jgi:hypothetical protein
LPAYSKIPSETIDVSGDFPKKCLSVFALAGLKRVFF